MLYFRSVGCTIIELLTQKPPYFDLTPMAALFRIVQDDHPPLPKNISPVGFKMMNQHECYIHHYLLGPA